MINRRLLRIKTLQVLYAHTKNAEGSIASAEKELKHSVEKTYQLYLLHFLLLKNFIVRAQIRSEQLQNLPIVEKEKLSPVLKIVENPFFKSFYSSQVLSDLLESQPTIWDENDQFTANLYSSFIECDAFKAFLDKENTFNAGKKLATSFLTETLMLNEDFHAILEEKNVYWNDDIAFVQPMIEKTIRKFKESSEDEFSPLPLYAQGDDEAFVLKLLRKAVANFDKYTDTIKSLSIKREYDRIPEMDILIIKMGIIEAIEFESIPTKVSLNEYIDLAKFYSSDKSRVFVNGILDKIYKQFTEEGTIRKIGRGLS